jgi:3-hydroxybutyryl-CoA dehydratase
MVRAGDRFTTTRSFTAHEVTSFAALTGDRGRHHLQPDGRGRLVVHGLLVAAVPTQLGGELDYIAREMVFEFLRPVFTGDTIDCELLITEAVEKADRLELQMAVTCRNHEGKDVLRGSSRGIVRVAAR